MVLRRDKRLGRALPAPREQRVDARRPLRLRVIAEGSAQGISRIALEEADAFSLLAPPVAWRSALLHWIDAYRSGTSAPLPPLLTPLTPLQQAISAIPFGQTRPYGALLGRNYAQSVGQACARNPYPLLVPCHRIVAAQGIGGFAFGIPLKQILLAFETFL